MEKADIITIEAVGEYPFEFFIEKAVATGPEDESEMIIEGVASTTNVDHDWERMGKDAIHSMANIINEKGVPLRVEHSKEPEAVIGDVFKAWVDERNQLHIQARVDKSHVVGPILYRAMKTGSKMGFSVGGIVKRAVQEFSEKLGRTVKTFYDVVLNEVSVTPRPANYDSWAVAKSIAKDAEEAERFRDAFQNRFLFDNPHLDYLQAFAKSIPDEAWRKTASQKTIMAKEDIKKESATDTENTEKAVSRAEFMTLVKTVADGFKGVFSVLKLAESPKDQVNPDVEKPVPIGAKGTDKAMDSDAKDQHQPDEKKPEPIGDNTMKAEDTDTDETKKAEDTEDTKEKAAKDTEDTYELESTVKAIHGLTERLSKATDTDTDETTKAEDTETDETKKAEETDTDETKKTEDMDTTEDKTKSQHPLDSLVMAMAKAMLVIGERMEKDGKRIPGFEKNWVTRLQNDPEFQKHVKDLMAVPGIKKSVSFGTAYVPTRDGGRLPLTLKPSDNKTVIEKSADAKGQSFQDLYKSQFSSVSQVEET